MAEFASNTPISGPIATGWNTDWDCNGWSWSYDFGLHFGNLIDEMIPIRKPVLPLRPSLR